MKRSFLLLPLALTMTACSLLPRGGGYFQDDGPGHRQASEIAHTPDATPRNEPYSRYGNKPYRVNGQMYYPLREANGYRERGVASWYGKQFHGRRTSSGDTYDMYAMTAAHRTLPLPSYVRVRNLRNGRTVVVRVNDRGPFLHNRVIDLSYAAAAKLGVVASGTGLVEVETINAEDYADPLVAVDRGGGAAVTTPIADASNGMTSAAAKPVVELIPTAAADTGGALPANSTNAAPKLYVQVGAFAQWENAIALRNRLERVALRPVFIESTLIPPAEAADGAIGPDGSGGGQQRIYRVRIGPLENVHQADLMTQQATDHGVPHAIIVVE